MSTGDFWSRKPWASRRGYDYRAAASIPTPVSKPRDELEDLSYMFPLFEQWEKAETIYLVTGESRTYGVIMKDHFKHAVTVTWDHMSKGWLVKENPIIIFRNLDNMGKEYAAWINAYVQHVAKAVYVVELLPQRLKRALDEWACQPLADCEDGKS